MRIVLSLFAITLGLAATTSGADDGLIIGGNSKQFWVQDAKKVYDSACSTVQHEFRISTPVRPRLTLIVGASENKASVEPREIRLTKWDPYLFAQGVVIFAFEDLLPDKERVAVAMRSVKLAESTVDVKALTR